MISIIISIIGCATGLLSLAIVILFNVFQIGSQKILLSNRRGSYYFNASDTKTEGCVDVVSCAVISLRVVNRSTYPISIDEAYLLKGKKKTSHFNDFKFDFIEVPTSPKKVSYIDTEEIATIPTKLDPFETKYIALAFPFFDSLIDEYGKDVRIKLIIVTSRKKQKMKIKLSEYYSFFPNFSKNFKSEESA